MPKKSRSACLTCRRRHSKCGAEQPACVACIELGVQCEGYDWHVASKSSTSNSLSNSDSQIDTKGSELFKELQQLNDETDCESRIERWRHETAPPAEEPKDTIQHIFFSCLDALNSLISRSDCSQREKNSLQRCHGTLQLWAHEHKLSSGALDTMIQRSDHVRQTILELLLPLFKMVLQGMSSLVLPLTDLQEVQDKYKSTLQIYQQNAWQINDSQTSSENDNEIAGTQLEPVNTKIVIRKIRIYTECLADFGPIMDCPASDDSDDEETSFSEIDQRTAEDYHIDYLRAKFPSAAADLLQCLGRASWERYQRMQRRRELNAQYPEAAMPEDGKSEFVDSGLGTSLPAATSSHAASVASVLSSVAGDKRVRTPRLSAAAKKGMPFECMACGYLVRYTVEHEWRKHLFNDLQPYSCFFTDCSFSKNPFLYRRTWVSHLELQHAFGPDWARSQCPFCLEIIDEGKKAIINHLSRHMEDIATAAIPQDIDSDDELGAESEPDEPIPNDQSVFPGAQGSDVDQGPVGSCGLTQLDGNQLEKARPKQEDHIETIWICSQCGDGPIASWNPCCENCGHAYCGACIVEKV